MASQLQLVPLEFETSVQFSREVFMRVLTAANNREVRPDFFLYVRLTKWVIPVLIAAELLDITNRMEEVMPFNGVAVCSFLMDNQTFMGFPILQEVDTAVEEGGIAIRYKITRILFLLRAFAFKEGTVRLIARLPVLQEFRLERIAVFLPVDISSLGIDSSAMAVVSALSYFFHNDTSISG